MRTLDELANFQQQVQAKSFIKEHKKQKAYFHSSTVGEKENIEETAVKTLDSERRSGQDRRTKQQMNIARFDPRNQNDRRKISVISCII